MANIARLKVLHDFLVDLQGRNGKFNMDQFFGGNTPRLPTSEPVTLKVMPCGMAACMGGWACTIPKFIDEGLRIVCYGPTPRHITPWYDNRSGFTAMERFFDLTCNQAAYLFDNTGPSYAAVHPDRSKWTPAHAAAHLADFIAHRTEAW